VGSSVNMMIHVSVGRVETDHVDSAERVSILVPTKFKARGNELRLIVEPAAYVDQKRCPRWISLIAQGHEARTKLTKLDRQTGPGAAIDRAALNRIARFAYLAPDIASAILDGRQPFSLSARKLKRMGELPLSWKKQRELLGVG
jgi:site-specific DNA recombinase